ncbi:MAG: hypothetical protein AAB665_00680 [Patescibacteria group bacterium]
MEGLFRKIKVPALIVLVVAIAVGVWWGLGGGGASDDELLATESASDESSIGDKDLVATLLALRSVSLSGTILSDPAFLGLKDFGTEIVPEPVGRPNPFAPLSPGATPPPATRGAQLFSPREQP